VIEGYPRSANTFAVAAFQFAQGRRVKIARNLHAPASVIQAVRWRIPALVLIRKPEDAVLSLLVREPSLSARQALADYTRFYEKIRPYRFGFVLATFEEVTSDFNSVIHRINHKFRTSFVSFIHNRENIAEVMKIAEEMDKADQGKPVVTEVTVARPSSVWDRLKQPRCGELEMPEVSKLMETAKDDSTKAHKNLPYPQPLPTARR